MQNYDVLCGSLTVPNFRTVRSARAYSECYATKDVAETATPASAGALHAGDKSIRIVDVLEARQIIEQSV